MGEDDIGSGIGGKYIYNGKIELVLVSSSDSYSKLDSIPVDTSRLSSCPTLYYLLTIYTTNYYSKEIYTNILY